MAFRNSKASTHDAKRTKKPLNWEIPKSEGEVQGLKKGGCLSDQSKYTTRWYRSQGLFRSGIGFCPISVRLVPTRPVQQTFQLESVETVAEMC